MIHPEDPFNDCYHRESQWCAGCGFWAPCRMVWRRHLWLCQPCEKALIEEENKEEALKNALHQTGTSRET